VDAPAAPTVPKVDEMLMMLGGKDLGTNPGCGVAALHAQKSARMSKSPRADWFFRR
jgi:hypothetical protein